MVVTETVVKPFPTPTAEVAAVDFWFDPACPWAWLTSRWIHNVEQVRPIRTTFRLMSLAMLNEDKDLSADVLLRLMGPVRVVQAVMEDHGHDAARVLYTELGNRKFVEQRQLTPEVVTEAVVAAGFDARYAEAFSSTEHDDAIRASHDAGLDLVGPDVGTPIIRAEGEAFFGPIVAKAPAGEEAGRLWDGFRIVMSIPGFYEIKKTRDTQPDFG
jgi:2-hydroxychromene-2-carboxylate isomerase